MPSLEDRTLALTDAEFRQAVLRFARETAAALVVLEDLTRGQARTLELTIALARSTRDEVLLVHQIAAAGFATVDARLARIEEKLDSLIARPR